MGLSLVNFSIDEIINPKLKDLRLYRKRARKVLRLERELARRDGATADLDAARPTVSEVSSR
jgi:peptide/nickel transport system permease protein